MNNKKKWTKSISVAMLVALAALATTGLVLADHLTPVEGVAVSSQTYFDQYQAAIEHMEEDQNAAFVTFSTSNVSSLEAFTQYNEALEQMRQEQAARMFEATVSKSNDTNMRWEQYFKYAR